MTQEELDRLMNGDFDDEVESAGDNNGTHETHNTRDGFDEIADLNNYDLSYFTSLSKTLLSTYPGR